MKYLLFALILFSCGSHAPKPSQRTHGDTLFVNDGSVDARNGSATDTILFERSYPTDSVVGIDTTPLKMQMFMVDTSGNAAYIVGTPSPNPLKIKMKPRWRNEPTIIEGDEIPNTSPPYIDVFQVSDSGDLIIRHSTLIDSTQIINVVTPVDPPNDSVFYIKYDPVDSGYLSKGGFDTFFYKVDSLIKKPVKGTIKKQ